MIGEVVDGHEILRPLGAGGMGEVYLGQGAGGSLRAFKVVRADRALAPQAAARFRREVRALGKLHHPGIIQILEAGQLPTGALYLGMEYVAGPDLQAAVGWDGPFGVADALRLLAQLAAALAYAHEAGVVHRDLKPSNVILADGDPTRAKIIDFGLAKIAADEGLTRVTEDDQLIGSPLYLAPEQSRTATITPAADVYALGGLAYFVLTGEPMFKPRPAVAMVYAHQAEVPARLSTRARGTELPPGLDALIAACVAKEPTERPTAADLVIAFDGMLAVAPQGERQRRAQRLFTRTGVSDFGQALTSQIRQVVVELAATIGRPTEAIEGIQHELSELELDLAMLDADAALADAEGTDRRTSVALGISELQSALADAYRTLLEEVDGDRRHAPPDAAALYAELDGLVAQYRAL